MTTPNLRLLSDDGLIELGAQLENELTDIELTIRLLSEEFSSKRSMLTEPGLKLAIDGGLTIVGLVSASYTLGWSLLLTAVGVGRFAWDGWEVGKDVQSLVQLRCELRDAIQDILLIKAQLGEIDALLTGRFQDR